MSSSSAGGITDGVGNPTSVDVPLTERLDRHAVRSALLSWGGLALCLALWVAGLMSTRVAGVVTSTLGLVSVLPVTFWVAVAVLMVSFCWTVMQRSTRWPALAAHVLALVAILHATPAILYGTLRYAWTWKHVGVIDFISHHGVVFNLNDIFGVYQGWPGFFSLNSFLTSASGLKSSLGYAPWVLPFNDLLWLGPVILIARAFSSDQRVIWTAAWLFTLANWVGQDYFSPQAFTYFLYLTVIAVCVRWLWNPRASRATARRELGFGLRATRLAAHSAAVNPNPRDPRSRRSKSTRAMMVACIVPMVAAIASSHQLTPFMLLAALIILALFRQLRPSVLLIFATTVITLGWLEYGARDWLDANRHQLLDGIGLLLANSSLVVGQGTIPFAHVLIDWGARILSVALGVLAIIGFLRYWHHHNARARRSWLRVALLSVAAIPAAAANNYGGEIIFRVYLFAIPFMAVAAAAAFFPHPRAGRSVLTGLVLGTTLLGLAAGYSLGNFGQESMNYFTPQEVAASDWLYKTAPQGAQLIGANSNFPWGFVHYNWYSYTFLDAVSPAEGRKVLRTPVSALVNLMEPGRKPASYLILTASQQAQISLTGEWAAAEFPRLSHDLLTSGKFRIVYQNADAMILQLKVTPVKTHSAKTAKTSVGSGTP